MIWVLKIKIEVNFINKEKSTENLLNYLSIMEHTNVEEKHSNIFHDGVLFIKIDTKNKNFEKNMCSIFYNELISINTNNQMKKSISLTLITSIQTVE